MADCLARPETSGQFKGFHTDDYFRRMAKLDQDLHDIGSRGFYGYAGPIEISSTVVLADGRIAVASMTNPQSGTLLIFAEQDGHWLIDERYTVVAKYTTG